MKCQNLFSGKDTKYITKCLLKILPRMLSVKRPDELARFSAIITKYMWLLVFFPAHQAPSEKESTLKGKSLLHLEANAFLSKYFYFKTRSKISSEWVASR